VHGLGLQSRLNTGPICDAQRAAEAIYAALYQLDF